MPLETRPTQDSRFMLPRVNWPGVELWTKVLVKRSQSPFLWKHEMGGGEGDSPVAPRWLSQLGV